MNTMQAEVTKRPRKHITKREIYSCRRRRRRRRCDGGRSVLDEEGTAMDFPDRG